MRIFSIVSVDSGDVDVGDDVGFGVVTERAFVGAGAIDSVVSARLMIMDGAWVMAVSVRVNRYGMVTILSCDVFLDPRLIGRTRGDLIQCDSS